MFEFPPTDVRLELCRRRDDRVELGEGKFHRLEQCGAALGRVMPPCPAPATGLR